jgi:hypothetical protein
MGMASATAIHVEPGTEAKAGVGDRALDRIDLLNGFLPCEE